LAAKTLQHWHGDGRDSDHIKNNLFTAVSTTKASTFASAFSSSFPYVCTVFRDHVTFDGVKKIRT
tara:strand:- start:5 stop:199 length:195 start_codon:yes stop_codon:yes gene_type:complete